MKKYAIQFLAIIAALLLCTGCTGAETVVEIDMPSQGSRAGEMPGGSMQSGEMPGGMDREMPSGEMPSGGMPGERGGQGEQPGPQSGQAAEGQAAAPASQGQGREVIGRVENIAGNRATLLIGERNGEAIEYGEETAAYLLPVGMRIGTGDFSSVTKGMVLQLWVDEAGGEENITSVSILSR